MGVSLKSIADDLNLSKATVSWILSGKGEERGFSAATIRRVREYAEQIGYTPNLLARSLSVGCTKTIGLIIPSISDKFYSQMASAVEGAVSGNGYTLVLGSSEGEEKKERNLIQSLCSQQVDGLIIAPTNKSDRAISALLRTGYPFVLIDRFVPKLKSNYVIVNNEESSCSLVKRLCEAGCRRIAIVTTDMHLFVMGKRVAGYVRAISESGLTVDKGLCLEIDRDSYVEDVKRKLKVFLDEHPDVDGFFFTTHYLAEEVMSYFLNSGIDYRNRYRFVCIHSTRTLEILCPEMLCAMMPIDEMGRTAVGILIDNISSKESFEFREMVLENELRPAAAGR